MNLRLFRLLYQQWWTGKNPGPPYRHVVQIGDPVLRQLSQPVDPALITSRQIQVEGGHYTRRIPRYNHITSSYLRSLQKDTYHELYKRLREMMKATGAAGLAAPQLGVSLRVFAVQCPREKDHPNPVLYAKLGLCHIPLQIWVNPTMKVMDYRKSVGEECCESMKGFSADVPRYQSVQLTGLSETGEEKMWEANGWSARLVQHEMDHLDGKFFTDLMIPKSLSCTLWDAINHHQGRIYTTFMPKR